MENKKNSARTFSTEIELNFTVPKKYLTYLLQYLSATSSQELSQKWFLKDTSKEGVIIQHRIRKSKGHYPTNVTYSYDTKYRFSTTDRLEFNAPITEEEYDTICKIHSDIPITEKTRITAVENTTGNVYYIDIFHEEPNEYLKIEIEFPNKEAMENYLVPFWLRKIIGKE